MGELVAGVDSSTQACKVVVRDASTGRLVRTGRAAHPDGTEVDPGSWWHALQEAVAAAGGLSDVAAIGVGAQQHGMVTLEESGQVVRDALLWNDTRSAAAADALVARHGGASTWAREVGVVPVAAFTVTKLAWLARHEPDNADRVAAVCLPHDWLTWRLAGGGPTRARGSAGGTAVPGLSEGALISAGSGDNAAAALGVGAGPGDVLVSIGTSGVVCAVTDSAATDPSGTVAGFADATGRYLPLVCTLNAARVLDACARMLRVSHTELADLALAAPPGAGGLVLVPYLEGERTPNRPTATGTLHGLTTTTADPAHLARAAVEGLLCGLADGIDALRAQGAAVNRVLLLGGGARSEAVCRIAPQVFGCPVVVPTAGEYVADGAARQAAWALAGDPAAPPWPLAGARTVEADPTPQVRLRYAEVRDLGHT